MIFHKIGCRKHKCVLYYLYTDENGEIYLQCHDCEEENDTLKSEVNKPCPISCEPQAEKKSVYDQWQESSKDRYLVVLRAWDGKGWEEYGKPCKTKKEVIGTVTTIVDNIAPPLIKIFDRESRG